MICHHCTLAIETTGSDLAPFIHMHNGSAYCGTPESIDIASKDYERLCMTQARPKIALINRRNFYELTPPHARSYRS